MYQRYAVLLLRSLHSSLLDRRGRHCLIRRFPDLSIGIGCRLKLSIAFALAMLLGIGVAGLCSVTLGGPIEPPGTILWDPAQSAAGQQADARLDRPVRFWRAGLSLTEVFAGIEQQTGVKLVLWPANDPSLDIHVTLFLNPEKPPSLREVLVQLKWATDTTVMCTEKEPEGGKKSYYLIWFGPDASETVKERERNRDESTASQRAEQAKELLARLHEHFAALPLSRDELLTRYQGKDDCLLLNLLDPRRRGALELLSRMSEDELQQAVISSPYYRYWGDLTLEEQAFWGPALSYDKQWLAAHHARIAFFFQLPNGLDVAPQEEVEDGQWQYHGRRIPPSGLRINFRRGSLSDARSEINLGRLLGETISPEEEREYISRWQEEVEQEGKRRQAERTAQEAAKVGESISPAIRDLLSNTPVPTGLRGRKRLWEVQEVVAKTLGLNIVSDAFCDLPHGLAADRGAASPENVREVLVQACRSRGPAGSIWDRWLPSTIGPNLAWEWQGTGSCLRFRSVYRALWRDSQLPPDVLAELNGWIDPHLASGTIGAKGASPQATICLFDLGRLSGRLSTAQSRYGGVLIYGDPSSPSEQARLNFRQQLVGIVGPYTLYKWIGSLREERWKQLQKPGIRLGDLSLSERLLLNRDPLMLQYLGTPSNSDMILRVFTADGVPGDRAKLQRYRLWLGHEGNNPSDERPLETRLDTVFTAGDAG